LAQRLSPRCWPLALPTPSHFNTCVSSCAEGSSDIVPHPVTFDDTIGGGFVSDPTGHAARDARRAMIGRRHISCFTRCRRRDICFCAEATDASKKPHARGPPRRGSSDGTPGGRL